MKKRCFALLLALALLLTGCSPLFDLYSAARGEYTRPDYSDGAISYREFQRPYQPRVKYTAEPDIEYVRPDVDGLCSTLKSIGASATGGKAAAADIINQFDAAYDDELLAAVKKLKDGNITDMVLDLRNNGGGHVITSNMLSTCIAGAACQGKVYEYYRYNDSRMATVEKTAKETGKEYDSASKKFFDEFYYGDYYGVDLRNYALNMTRLYVLVTGNTASSSEAVINTLRGLDGFTVKLIGEKTNGKNVGMEVSKFTVGNYSYELAPISFQGYNAKQVTVDKNGLAVDTACEEWDGELKDYGDRSEPMLAAALSQITGQKSVSVSGTRSTAPGVRPATDITLPDLSNRPSGMIVFLPASEE